MQHCANFWFQKPSVLIEDATSFFPFMEEDKRCTATALNSFTRFGIYIGILLAILRMEPKWLLVGVLFGLFSVVAWFWMEQKGTIREGMNNKQTEHFDGGYEARKLITPIQRSQIVDNVQLDSAYIPDVIGSKTMEPIAANPFMNVLMTEYTDNPVRAPAASIQSPGIRSDIDQFFETMFADDPGDVFRTTQSQRIWITQPSTTIPNDQDAYQNWLYRVPGKTCKEGNGSVCNFTTDSKIPWREIGPIS